MDILNNIDNDKISMDDYDEYNDILDNGYLMINDGKEMYSVFLVYNDGLEDAILNAFKELDNDDIFNLMQYADDEGLVWLGYEDDELIAYSNQDEDNPSDEANNYYNDDMKDFISELRQLETSDIVKTFIFKNTTTGDMFICSPGGLGELYQSLNILGK